MKKNLLLRTGLLLSLAITNISLFAQSDVIAYASTPRLTKVATLNPAVANNDVNGAGIALVEKMYGKVNQLQVFADQNYQTAYFEKDAKQVRAVFNTKGNFLYAIATYNSPSDVPSAVMETLKNLYPNKQIHGVTELTGKAGTAYRVILKEPASMLTVEWMEGNIREVEKLYQHN